MAIGLFPGLTSEGPPRTTAGPRSYLTAKAANSALAGAELVVLSLVAVLVGPRPSQWSVWAFPLMAVALLAAYGHYSVKINLVVSREARSLLACLTAPLVVMVLAGAARTPYVLATAGVSSVSLLAIRAVAYRVIRTMRSKGLLAERTLIVGAGQVAVNFSTILEQHPEYGMRPVGFLDEVDGDELPLPLFGSVDLLRLVLSEEEIDRVVVAFGVTREAEMLETIRACEDAAVDIHVLPRFFELGVAVEGREVDDIWGIPLVRLRRSLRVRSSRVAKRLVDVTFAGVGLMLVAPVYVLLAAAVKLSSHGPVYFRQERVGQYGALVDVLKFRTMRVHDGSDLEWVAPEDRVTKIGGLMRRLGLDELPQLWSVLRGDMSLVGPRPERPFFVERFKGQVPHYDARHRVPVGLTGLAQVHGLRGDTSIDERARFDNRYIESWSLWRDLVIMVQTVSAVIKYAIASSSDGDEPARQPSRTESRRHRRRLQPVVLSGVEVETDAAPAIWPGDRPRWDEVASTG